MKYIRKLLKFLQLVDREGNLSITNIATIVVITKIALTATFDWGVISALLVTLLNYGHKRYEANKASKDVRPAAIAVDLKPLQDSINELADNIQEVKKVADEAKDKASKVALASGITTKRLG